MNKFALYCLFSGCSVLVAKAAPADDIKAAVQKLNDSANYTWTTTTDAGGGGGGGYMAGPVTGMTQKDGMTMINREFNGNTMSVVRKGDKVVRQNRDGEWMTNEEMMAQFQGGGGGGGGGGGKSKGKGRGGPPQMGAAVPTEQIATLLAGVKGDYMIVNGAFVADLSPDAITSLITMGRGGRRGGGGGGGADATKGPPAPKDAKGSVKFWLTDGVLTKFELHLTATIQGRNGDMDIDRTTTTEFKNIGTTKFDVPADALKKLNAS